jgi:arabinofuranan 3-O-arabinosyltransferase
MAAVTHPAVAGRPSRDDEATDELDVRLRERLRVLLCCLCLGLLATATRPGKMLADTKIDMPIDPTGLLSRALHMWDIEQFGQLQNQASGYLFPMGPFFALGHLAGIPGWITQRMWLGLLLCTAFLGVRTLAGRLGIGTPTGRLLGAMAYALGPHGLTSLGTNSSEYVPLAMLPWIIVPLATVTRRGGRPDGRGSGRIKAAAWSGLAVACCGGINATAVLAVLVVPGLFVLTRPRGCARIRLLAWWSAAVAIATAWWTVPLLLLGKYAFSWLTYTEKASTTTATTGLLSVFRGSERWVNSLVVNGQVWWPVGHMFVSDAFAILATGAVAALGLAGLARRDLPERTFLLVTLIIGIVIIVAGHAGPLGDDIRHLIDGPLAPFRNLYKFDGLIRLPIALGIAHLLTPAPVRRPRVWPALVALLAVAGVAGSTLSTGLSASGDFRAVPQYWNEATTWLNGHAGQQGVIIVPGSRFAEYLWGRPMDEITESSMRARWAERQLVPAGSPGLTRLLDAIDQRITSGLGSPGLSQVLARIGVRYILVRNDLRRDDLRGAWPARVHEAMDSSPGIRRAVWFGGVPAGSTLPDDAVNSVDQPYPPVEIYEVTNADSAVSMTGVDQAIRMYGSPEALLILGDNGLLGGRPVLLDDDDPQAPGRAAVSDSLRRVQRNFGELRGQTSPTMTAAEDDRRPGDQRDIMDNAWDHYSTVASYGGIKNVSASSSASDITSIVQLDNPGTLPFAAIDGNPFTQWMTGGWNGPIGQWLQVDFGRRLTPRNVTATFTQDPWLGPPPARIAVSTQAGRIVQAVGSMSAAQPLRVPAGPSTWLRITILALTAKPAVPTAARVAIPELHIDGVKAVRHYRLPSTPGGGTVVMSRPPGRLPGCMQGSVRWVCSPVLQRQDEEGYAFDRVFSAPVAKRALLTGTATLTDTALIQRYMSTDPNLHVSASSVATSEPAGMARSAFDADPTTTWVPAMGDTDPTLALSWGRAVVVRQLTIMRPGGASGPLNVRVEGDRGQWREGVIGADGELSFQAMRTTRLTLRFPAESPQVIDVSIPGVPTFRSLPGARVPLPCGYGPKLRLNGRDIATRASGTFGDLLAGRPLRFKACHTVGIRSGGNLLASVPFDGFRIETAVVDPAGGLYAAPPAAPSYVQVTKWTSQDRTVEVNTDQDSYLIVDENFNAGWTATIGGRKLQPVRLDGWRQGWIVPAGTIGTAHLVYEPDHVYRTALFAGFGALPMLLLVALWPARLTPLRSRARPGPVRGRSVGRVGAVVGDVVVVLVAAGVGYWVSGIPGTAVAAVAAGLFAWVPLRFRAWVLSPWAIAAVMSVATVVAVAGRNASGSRFTLLTDTLPRLLCLVVVARLAVALSGSPERRSLSGAPPPRGEPEDRPLQEVERGGGDRDGQYRDDRELDEEVPAEGLVAGEVVPADRDGHLPEEDAVGDAAEEPHEPVAENGAHDRRVGAGEGHGGYGEGGDQPVQHDPELRGPDRVDRDQIGGAGEW